MSEQELASSDGQPEEDEVPLRTMRSYDSCMETFGSTLSNHAVANMQRRGSQTPTDADVLDAFRELTRENSASKARRVFGDAGLIAGGVMLPLWDITLLLPVAGVVICCLGLYIREFSEG